MECFIASITQSIYPIDANRFDYFSVIVSNDTTPVIPQNILDSLDNSENIETTIPVTVKQIVFTVPGSTTHTAILAFDSTDQTYVANKLQLKVINGRMPTIGTDEIAIDENVAKNNNLQIGSQTDIDKSYNLDRHYTVVGILESDSHISIVGSPEPNNSTLKNDERGYLVFPKEGHFEQAEKEIESLSSQGITTWTLSLYNRLFEKNNQTFQILDIMIILAIIVMAVCLVCSKYAQYFSRKNEVGILSALGYTQGQIIKRTFFEVVATNILGFILGLALAILISKLFVANYFNSIGGTGIYFYGKAAVLALLAPMITTVFTLVPVYRLIRRVDAISIVESN